MHGFNYLTSMVLIGIAALREGVTKERMEAGRNRLETPKPITSRRDAEERFNRQAAAENIVTTPNVFTGCRNLN